MGFRESRHGLKKKKVDLIFRAPNVSDIISSFMSMISDCFSNSIMIFWICGMFICLFMFCIARVTPFMAWAIAFWDLRVWILRDTAWMLARISMNFFTWRRVRTRS